MGVNPDTLWRLHQIGGADLALRYAEISRRTETTARLQILDLRFFGSGSQVPDVPLRDFTSRFPKSTTRYVHFHIDLRNPRKYVSFTYDLLARCYKPDGSLAGQLECRIEAKPKWDTFWQSGGWGWDRAGGWTAGRYRVEVEVGDARTSGEFEVFEDRPQTVFDTQITRLSKGEHAMSKQQSKGLGLDGWLEKLSQELPINREPFRSDQPLDDLGKMRQLMAIDRRYMLALPNTQPGRATPDVVKSLEQIAADYEEMLKVGLPSFAHSQQAVRVKIGDALSSAAQASEALRDYAQARMHYIAAIDAYTRAGNDEKVRRYQADLERLKFSETGNVDGEIKRLRKHLARLPADSLEAAEALIDLAMLYHSNGDDPEAKEHLRRAETILAKYGADPNGADLAAALTKTLLGLKQDRPAPGPSPIETTLKANGLYRALYLGYARIYQRSNPQEAASYRLKAARRDSRQDNDAFSSAMLQALKGDLGRL